MNEFDQMLKDGYAETAEMLFVRISVADHPEIKEGGWQSNERGKSLSSQAGFEMDMGGSLILRKSDVQTPSTLSGKIVTRLSDGLKMRIRGVNETRVSFSCELQPESR